MIKKNMRKMILTSLLILLPVIAGLMLWNDLPEQIATHWGANGEPDGWTGKPFAVFGIPAVLIAVHWLCMAVTGSDKNNHNQTKKILEITFWICPVISIVCSGMVYCNAMGVELDVLKIGFLLIGVLFLILGNYLPKCKHNYTIGIKIPWTLASEENWNATHRFAGKVWVAGSILLLICAFLPVAGTIWIAFCIMLVLVVLPTLYSYLYSRKHNE
jgi:uncharacterized membrane protein